MYAQPSRWMCKAAIYFHYRCLKLAFPLFGTKLSTHSIQLGAVFGILAVQICQPKWSCYFFSHFFSTGTYLMHQISESYLYIYSPLVIYSGLSLFQDAQKGPHSLSSFNHPLAGRAACRGGDDEMCVNTISRCAFETIKLWISFTFEVKLSVHFLKVKLALAFQVSKCAQHHACKTYGLTWSVCVFANRMRWQFTGQQWQLFLPWLPQRVLCLHALHLENICHTRRKGKNIWGEASQMSVPLIKIRSVFQLLGGCLCNFTLFFL